jgi:hypothetical protein
MAKKSLIVTYHWFHHYRDFIFNEISKKFDLKLIGDKKSRYQNLKLMDLISYNTLYTYLVFSCIFYMLFTPICY